MTTYNNITNYTRYKKVTQQLEIPGTISGRRESSPSHFTKNISMTGIDEALAHVFFTFDVDSNLHQ